MKRKKTEIIKVDVERNHRDRRRLVLTPAPRFNLRIAGVLAVLMIALSSTAFFMLTGEKGEIVPPPTPSRRILGVYGSNPNDPAWTIDVIGDENFRILSDSTVRMLITGVGNVGIGTETPGALLTLRRSTAGNVFATRNTADTADTFSITDAGIVNLGTWQGAAIGVAHGGTGQSSLTAGRVLIGAGTSPVTLAGPTAANQVLRSTAADSPAWGNLVVADMPAGTIVLLYADETDSSETTNSTAETTLKSWDLPSNSYSKIIVECEVRSKNEYDSDTKYNVTWKIYEGGTVRKSYTHKQTQDSESGHDGGDTHLFSLKTSFPGGQTATTTLKVTGTMSVANSGHGILAHSFRVYGVK